MRTTLDIDDDLLDAAKDLARQQGRSAGQVVSRLMRQALTGQAPDDPHAHRARPTPSLNGFQPFPARGVVVSNALIDQLRDAEGV